MRDNHLHTYFSYDSDADFREYLESYDGEIVTTEHFDLSNPYAGRHSDDIPDYTQYQNKIDQLNKEYGNRIKKGIEIGYYAPRKDDILSFLSDKTYDLKLLSVHHNGEFDYLEDAVFKLDKMKHINDYLETLIEAMDNIEADVLAHFDYGFRKLSVTVDELKLLEETLKSVFEKMIAHQLAFELNAKSMYLYGNKELYCYALSLIVELGGQKFSVGSDAHCLEHFRLEFADIENILKSYGIRNEMII